MKKFLLTCCLLQWALFALHAQSVNKQLENVPTTTVAGNDAETYATVPGTIAEYLEAQTFSVNSELVKLPQEFYDKVKNLTACTVAIDVTLSNLPTDRQVLFSCSNLKVADNFFGVSIENNKFGVTYHYSLDGNTTKDGVYSRELIQANSRQTILITMDPKGKNEIEWGMGAYSFYTDSDWKGTVDTGEITDGVEKGFGIFNKIEGDDGLYIGGVKGTDGKKTHGFVGTIHSIKVWDKVLSGSQCQEVTKSVRIAGTMLFDTPSGWHAKPYRIPALAKAKNGNLIAIADYRHKGGDIGSGQIDLKYRIGTNNGATWGEEKFLVRSEQTTAYGDAAIVADRESDNVLVMCASGMVSYHDKPVAGQMGVTAFRSTDNGETWGSPIDKKAAIYNLFANLSSDKKADKLFIASGKITQSQLYKFGNYYRIYCAMLVKNVDKGTSQHDKTEEFCAAIYSDDFGETWKLLGTLADFPVPVGMGANEAKVEELPDGSVVLSARATARKEKDDNGRIFNIFNYTNAAKDVAEGFWNIPAFSGKENQGVACNNSTNGEILCVPVKRKDNPTPIYLMLQSLPTGAGRNQVSIYYKPIESFADFNLPRNIAKKWEGVFTVTDHESAYSTMVLQDDHRIGFLYEDGVEVSHLAGAYEAYDIYYRNFDITDITNGKYSYYDATVEDRAQFITTSVDGKMELLKSESEHIYVGQPTALTDDNLTVLSNTIKTFKDKPTIANYNAINAKVVEIGNKTERIKIIPNHVYRLINVEGKLDLSLPKSGEKTIRCVTSDKTNIDHFFIFESVKGQDGQIIPNTYKIKSANHGWYIGKLCSKDGAAPWTFAVETADKEDNAEKFEITSDQNGVSFLKSTTEGPFYHYTDSKYNRQYLSLYNTGWTIDPGQGSLPHPLAKETELVAWNPKDYWETKEWAYWNLEPVEFAEVKMNGSDGEFWSSLYLPFAVTIPEKTNVQAFIGKENAEHNRIQLEEIHDIPLQTGVILKSTEKIVHLPLTYKVLSDVTGNSLEGTLKPMSVNWLEYYTLGSGSKGVGMYRPRRISGNETTSTIPRNKAFYHPTTAAETPAFYLFSFGDDMTDIDEVETTPAQQEEKVTVYYDLSGRRVMNPTHGIYIANGRKVYIK